MIPYAVRAIDIEFTRQNSTFALTGTNQVRLSGLRVLVQIERPGVAIALASVRLFGMTLSLMNDLSTLGTLISEDARNTVAVFAGEENGAMPLAFYGVITEAFADFRGMPEVAFQVQAQTAFSYAIAPTAAISHPGSADVVTMLQQLATDMGLAFENSGVSGVKLSDPYYPGNKLQQAQQIADHAGINMLIHDNTMAIWPIAAARAGPVPEISAETNMVGYPAYTRNGLDLTVRYDPAIQLGGFVNIKSSLPKTSGKWVVYSLSHHLEARAPGGGWFSQIKAIAPGTYGLL